MNLIKYEAACVAIAECNTMNELKKWNDLLKVHLETANYKQDFKAAEDAVKIATQINRRMKQLLIIQGELIEEMTNEI
jgi:arsenate reductase-like glutaredoxin family protein